jgi:inosose dehydratase
MGGARAGPASAPGNSRRTPALNGIRVANAPCSYGAFEITVGVLPDVPDAEAVLAAIAAAGYEGTELGPPGYLGSLESLRERFERHGLALVGGYIPIRFSEPEHWEEDLLAMDATLELFAAADGAGAKAVLADARSDERIRFPGRAASDRSIGLDDDGWRRLAEGVARAAGLARGRGFEPTFHHHTATLVEVPWEIERVLELTDVGLLLDTGHLALGGGDAAQAVRAWGERINHIHVKDVDNEVLASVIEDRADMPEAWRRGVFCELGTGDVDLDAFFAELKRSRYEGWLVVEQDMVPQSPQDAADAAASQERNREWLKDRVGI